MRAHPVLTAVYFILRLIVAAVLVLNVVQGDYEKARAPKPGQITTLYALAKYAIEDGNPAKAREHIDKALMHSASRICPVSTEELHALKAQLS